MNQFLQVSAGVRYWEDATVNGKEDTDGTLIPFRIGDRWCPMIDLDNGEVVLWPTGMVAEVHYKVCDDGKYWLADALGTRSHKWRGDYVPDAFLCHGDRGHGDYIILNIGPDGKIADYRKPEFHPESWDALTSKEIAQLEVWAPTFPTPHGMVPGERPGQGSGCIPHETPGGGGSVGSVLTLTAMAAAIELIKTTEPIYKWIVVKPGMMKHLREDVTPGTVPRTLGGGMLIYEKQQIADSWAFSDETLLRQYLGDRVTELDLIHKCFDGAGCKPSDKSDLQ